MIVGVIKSLNSSSFRCNKEHLNPHEIGKRFLLQITFGCRDLPINAATIGRPAVSGSPHYASDRDLPYVFLQPVLAYSYTLRQNV